MSDPAPLIVVFTGGDRVPAAVTDRLPADAFVIAADSGVDHALAAGRHVDLAVGDFDSVSAAGLERVTAEGGGVDAHRREKDETDLALALDHALGLGPDEIIVVGGHGGRLDHFLGNVAVLSSERYRSARLQAWFGHTRVHVVRAPEELEFEGEPGDLVTLLAIGADAEDVTTRGLRYPLDHESLPARSSRGVSNEIAQGAHRALVTVGAGALLVIRPGPEPGTSVR